MYARTDVRMYVCSHDVGMNVCVCVHRSRYCMSIWMEWCMHANSALQQLVLEKVLAPFWPGSWSSRVRFRLSRVSV